MILNKYQKFMKGKASNQTTANSVGEKEKKDYIKFYNPNRSITGKDEIFVRVIPNKKGMFFVPYKRHSFKIGVWKNAICGFSPTPSGESYLSTCPFCEFVNENKDSLTKDAVYQLSQKDQYMSLIYDPWTDEMLKYDFNDYALTDILTALYKLGEDFDPDVEGFNLHFKKGSSGYAEIHKVSAPEETVKELLSKSQVVEIPDLVTLVFPPLNKFIENQIQSTFQLAVNVFAPTFNTDSKESETDDEENVNDFQSDYDPNDDSDFESEEKFDFEKENIEDEELSGEDLEIADLEKALAARKKK